MAFFFVCLFCFFTLDPAVLDLNKERLDALYQNDWNVKASDLRKPSLSAAASYFDLLLQFEQLTILGLTRNSPVITKKRVELQAKLVRIEKRRDSKISQRPAAGSEDWKRRHAGYIKERLTIIAWEIVVCQRQRVYCQQILSKATDSDLRSAKQKRAKELRRLIEKEREKMIVWIGQWNELVAEAPLDLKRELDLKLIDKEELETVIPGLKKLCSTQEVPEKLWRFPALKL